MFNIYIYTYAYIYIVSITLDNDISLITMVIHVFMLREQCCMYLRIKSSICVYTRLIFVCNAKKPSVIIASLS